MNKLGESTPGEGSGILLINEKLSLPKKGGAGGDITIEKKRRDEIKLSLPKKKWAGGDITIKEKRRDEILKILGIDPVANQEPDGTKPSINA